MTDNETQLNV